MNSRCFCGWLTWVCVLPAGAPAPAAQGPAAKIPEVPVVRPVVRDVTDHEIFTGRLETPTRVDVRARVTGYLLKADFQEGADVKQGQVLFEIDPRPYRAELDRTRAALVQAEARFKVADINHKRVAALHARKAASQEEFDKVSAERVEAEALVQLAKANLDIARLSLDFTRVSAPVSGRIGRRLVDPGNLVEADKTSLAALVTLDPLYVYFHIDERTLLRLRQARRQAAPAEKVPVAIALADEKGFPHRGAMDFANNRLDPNTGTLEARAVLANKDRLLAPGMFARVRLDVGKPYRALLVPADAVRGGGETRHVLVVNDKGVIERRPVTLGQQHDGLRVVTAGLKAETWVVVGGPEGLRPGMAVRPRPGNPPKRKAAPAPASGGTSAGPFRRGPAGSGILIEASYPGASATDVSDAVRAPIEEQLGGLEKLRFMRSRCTNDGRYAVALTFAPGVDLWKMQFLTQNRTSLALPVLPKAVREAAVWTNQGTSGVQLFVNLLSPDNRFDSRYLSNYAVIQMKDELTRVAGVGEVSLIGHTDNFSLRVWLDPDRLAARNLDAGDVTRALAEQKGAGEVDPERLANLVLKADGEGRMVRLRDVARVELGAGRRDSRASLDGKPVAALVIQPLAKADPRELRAALRDRLTELRARMPDGLALDVSFDFTANRERPDRPSAREFLLLDLDMPAGASTERAGEVLRHCEALVRAVPGVQHVLALSENPFDLFGSRPCLLILLTPAEQRQSARPKVIEAVRDRVKALEGAAVRLRDLSEPGRFPRCGYPIDLAVRGPEADRVREWAELLGERLRRSKRLADVWVNQDSVPRPQQRLEIDREAAARLGVAFRDITTTLQVHAGLRRVADFNRFGLVWPVEIKTEGAPDISARELRRLKIRSARGLMIPLSALAKVREFTGPPVLDFLDHLPMVEVTANLATGESAAELRKLCERAADEARTELGLSGAYRLTWLQETSKPK
jgi:RND family efflux transporter MFP subunit